MRAFEDAPKGLLIVARRARDYGKARGNLGAGLLMFAIKRGDHFEAELRLEQDAGTKKTGWRKVRGSHGEGWVRDPDGTDTPPTPW